MISFIEELIFISWKLDSQIQFHNKLDYLYFAWWNSFSVCILLSVQCSELGSKAQSSGVVVDVVSHEGGDHVVRMIEQRLHPHMAGVAGIGCGGSIAILVAGCSMVACVLQARKHSVVASLTLATTTFFHTWCTEASSFFFLCELRPVQKIGGSW